MPDASDAPSLPEPTEEDEVLALAFLEVKDAVDLQGTPAEDQRCGTCHFVHDPARAISLCWHDDLGIPVGTAWRCDRWTPAGEADVEEPPARRRAAETLQVDVVERQRWRDHPVEGALCRTCRYVLTPEDTVSYCWRPGMQVGVGFDHWCRGWEAPPGAL